MYTNAIKDTYLYAIGLDDSPLIKIGHSKNPDARIRQIQPFIPFPIYKIFSIEASKPVQSERCAHIMMHHFKAWGEWYDIPREKLPEILKIACERGRLVEESKHKRNYKEIPVSATQEARILALGFCV